MLFRVKWLQWGRALMSTEIDTLIDISQSWPTLQWGRALMSTEITWTPRAPERP